MAYFIVGNEQEGRIGPSEMPTSSGVLLTVAEPLLLVGFLFSNRTSGALTATVNLCADGAAAANANQIIPAVNVAANDNIVYNMPGNGIPVSLGDVLRHVASGAGINVTLIMSRRNR